MGLWAQEGVYANVELSYPLPPNYFHGLSDIGIAQDRVLDGRFNPQAFFAPVTAVLTETIPSNCHSVICTVPLDAVTGIVPVLQVLPPCLQWSSHVPVLLLMYFSLLRTTSLVVFLQAT